MSSANRNSFTYFIPIFIPFLFFSCLINLNRTASTVLNSSGEMSTPCVAPHLRVKVFSLSPLGMLAVNFS